MTCFGCYGWLAADLLIGDWGVCCCGGFGVVFFRGLSAFGFGCCLWGCGTVLAVFVVILVFGLRVGFVVGSWIGVSYVVLVCVVL